MTVMVPVSLLLAVAAWPAAGPLPVPCDVGPSFTGDGALVVAVVP